MKSKTCKDSTLSVAGSYTATTFVADSKFHAMVGGQSFNTAIHITAKRVADTCKAGDE